MRRVSLTWYWRFALPETKKPAWFSARQAWEAVCTLTSDYFFLAFFLAGFAFPLADFLGAFLPAAFFAVFAFEVTLAFLGAGLDFFAVFAFFAGFAFLAGLAFLAMRLAALTFAAAFGFGLAFRAGRRRLNGYWDRRYIRNHGFLGSCDGFWKRQLIHQGFILLVLRNVAVRFLGINGKVGIVTIHTQSSFSI